MTVTKEMLFKYSKNGKLHTVNEKAIKELELENKCVAYYSSSNLNPEQKSLLKGYYEHLQGTRDKVTSMKSIYNEMINIYQVLRKVNIPVKSITRTDIDRYYANARDLKAKFEKKLSHSSIIHRNVVFKKFMKWYYETKLRKKFSKDEYPACVNHLSTKRMARELNLSDLPTRLETFELVKVADNLRDKLIPKFLRETGARCGEVINLNISDVTVQDKYADVYLYGKGQKGRNIVIVECVPDIKEFLNSHPYADNPNAPFFLNISYGFYGRRLLYLGYLEVVKRLASRAGLKKNISPHMFRHSRATELAALGWTEPMLREYFGWSKTSRMPTLYVHLGQSDVKKKILEMHGLLNKEESKQDKDERNALKPRSCVLCNKENPSDKVYCECGAPLDLKTVMQERKKKEETENKLTELFRDEGFQGLVLDYLKNKQKVM